MANKLKVPPTTEKVWKKLEKEFITTEISINGLAKKYGLPYSRVRTHSEACSWQYKREKANSKIAKKSVQKISGFLLDENERILGIADELLKKVEASVELLDPEDRSGMKQLTACIKDLKEMGIFKAELDRKEQEARIKKLQKDTEEENKDTSITVTLSEGIKDYAD
ncbi:MAG: hypothetical protein PHP50_09655 [Lachnospiraceae bacterium]|nr:hypothetical protein [Lachnospiraceae bacterium]